MARFIPNENTFVGVTPGPVGAMAAPANVTATAQPGGAIAVGAVAYIITAINGTGETAGSTAATGTTTSGNQAIQLTWDPVAGADGYRIYGRASGTEKLITQVGKVTSFLDTGALPAQPTTPPTVGSASNLAAPTVADVNESIELTEFVSGLNFSAQGNTVPTPNIARLFETSIPGTSQGTATMDCYRDDEIDTAWEVLTRGSTVYVILSRYGGKPGTAGRKCEVWPLRVASRAMANLTSNTPATFTTTFGVIDDPAEDAVVVA